MEKETFADFLRGQRVITKFKKNCKTYNPYEDNNLPKTITDDALNIFANEHGRNCVSTAFLWVGTPEGYKFWENIFLKWRNYKP